MATNKALRAAPPKRLDNYVVSIKKLFGGPDSVPDSAFIEEKYLITYQDILLVNPYDGYSDYKPIGFDIKINDKTYREFAVSCGWMVLKDPDGGTTGPTFWYDVLDSVDPQAQIGNNAIINPTFSYDHILLAPWFDRNIPTARTIDELQLQYYTTKITPSVEQDIEQGKDVRNWPYDSVDHGVRYLNSYDSKKGKYLLVRWTVSQNNYNNRIKFEVALYESGRIEYRYWPSKTYEASDGMGSPSYATVGIFWSNSSLGANKFRDIAPLFDHNKEARTIYELGGSQYSPAYSETSDYWSNVQPYSMNASYLNWPKNGAVVTFSPPTNPGKFLPRKISSLANSTKKLVPKTGLFDDRKTVNFYSSSVLINMPSSLPSRLIGDTGDIDISLQQLLFTSGSIKMYGSVKKNVIDSQKELLNVFESAFSNADFSFNESQKNYDVISEDSFYSAGSALEIFGDGFSTPLKSKVQFNLSFPVAKSSKMPPTTSSFYYYDVEKSMWTMANPGGYRPPEAMVADSNPSAAELGIGDNQNYKYRVTETSKCFDAVGRKVVSGSSIIDFSNLISGSSSELTFQTDSAIGAIFNSDAQFENEASVNSAMSKKYVNTVQSNKSFYPEKSQIISFPTEYPFLIEKVVVSVPLYMSGSWFKDLTTCNRAFGDSGDSYGVPSGAIDFGGPGLTFALMCPRRTYDNCYLDLIASGTITHEADDTASVVLYKDSGMSYYSMRPVGFRSFSNPTTVVSGTNNVFSGDVKLKMEAAVAGGLTIARNDRSLLLSNTGSNAQHAYALISSSSTFFVRGGNLDPDASALGYNYYNAFDNDPVFYTSRAPRIYIQQVSPQSRGSTGFEFSGNSILGGSFANFNLENVVKNPLYISQPSSLPVDVTTAINSPGFNFEAVSLYSTVDSRPSPYLIFPGDKIVLSISKTRPVIYKAVRTGGIPLFGGFGSRYESYYLTGSHDTVMLNTGSINVTIYGSYVREGVEYNP